MEIFIIEHGDLRLQISSLELQYTLQEHANEMLQGPTLLLKPGTSLCATLISQPLTPMSFDNALLDPLLRDPNAKTAASQTTADLQHKAGQEEMIQ